MCRQRFFSFLFLFAFSPQMLYLFSSFLFDSLIPVSHRVYSHCNSSEFQHTSSPKSFAHFCKHSHLKPSIVILATGFLRKSWPTEGVSRRSSLKKVSPRMPPKNGGTGVETGTRWLPSFARVSGNSQFAKGITSLQAQINGRTLRRGLQCKAWWS